MRKLMSDRKNGSQQKPLWALRTQGLSAQTTARHRLKKSQRAGAGGNFRHPENRKGLRYNDLSVYPRAKSLGALFELAFATLSGSSVSFFTPTFSLGTHANLAQLDGFLHPVDLQSRRAG
jgi:hypothetical protein